MRGPLVVGTFFVVFAAAALFLWLSLVFVGRAIVRRWAVSGLLEQDGTPGRGGTQVAEMVRETTKMMAELTGRLNRAREKGWETAFVEEFRPVFRQVAETERAAAGYASLALELGQCREAFRRLCHERLAIEYTRHIQFGTRQQKVAALHWLTQNADSGHVQPLTNFLGREGEEELLSLAESALSHAHRQR